MRSLHVRLRFDGPVLSAGVGARRIGLDAEMRHDADGKASIAASHLRGHLREALEELVLQRYAEKNPDVLDDADGHKLQEARKKVDIAVAHLFGAPADRRPNVPGVLRFTDLRIEDGEPLPSHAEELVDITYQDVRAGLPTIDAPTVQSRIAINPRTGSVRQAGFALLEAANVGTETWYRARIDVPEKLPGGLGLDADGVLQLLGWAFEWMGHVGKQGSAGWGRIARRELKPETDVKGDLLALIDRLFGANQPDVGIQEPPPVSSSPVQTADSNEPITTLSVVFVARGPILISDGGANRNVFEGRGDLPGSVIRRALADVLLEAAGRRAGGWIDDTLAEKLDESLAQVARRFAEVRASFALPLPMGADGSAAPVIPYPTTAAGDKDREPNDDTLLGILAAEDAVSGMRSEAERIAGTSSDRELLSPAAIRRLADVAPRSAQVHVASSRLLRAAQDGMLYSSRAINPVYPGQGLRVAFKGTVTCPTAIEGSVRKALARIQRVGKATGRGYGEVRVYTAPPTDDPWSQRLDAWNQRLRSKWPKAEERLYVPITLVTDALLLPGVAGKELTLGARLDAAYLDAWCAIMSDAKFPELSAIKLHFVGAFHRLWGGATARGSGAVPPAVLTQAGSTFALSVPLSDAKAMTDALEFIVSTGVERSDVVDALDDRWQRRSPLRRANGYGQIIVCHPHHFRRAM